MGTHVTSPQYVETRPEAVQPNRESDSSRASWGSVIAGAFVAAALYLILLAMNEADEEHHVRQVQSSRRKCPAFKEEENEMLPKAKERRGGFYADNLSADVRTVDVYIGDRDTVDSGGMRQPRGFPYVLGRHRSPDLMHDSQLLDVGWTKTCPI